MGDSKIDGEEFSAARLKHCVPCPFVLEGVLEEDIYEKSRSEHPLLAKWLGCFTDQISIKTAYHLSDIKLLAGEIGFRHPPFIHISCHGDLDEKSRRPFIVLFKERIYLDDPETIDVFSMFKGYPLFFSACNLGKLGKPIQEFRAAAGLGPVAASTREVLDTEAMLFGLMLYQAILDGGMEFEDAVLKSIQAGKLLGISGRQGHGQAYVRLFS
jgi:hypothetical protein